MLEYVLHDRTQPDFSFYIHTRFPRSTVEWWYDNFTKKYSKGEFKPAEMMDVAKPFFPDEKKAKSVCNFIFNAFDLDSNGRIDFKDLVLAIDILEKVGTRETNTILIMMYEIVGASGSEMFFSPEKMAKKRFSQVTKDGDISSRDDEFIEVFFTEKE